MHFEGEFRVPGKAQDVIRRFADVPRMATCMPGALLEPQAEDGSWPGAMVVSFGPKRINFKGKASVDFDFDALTGAVTGRGTADMRAARIGVKVAFSLSNAADSPKPETIVKIVSDAELGGVLADFAKTGGIAVANVIMADFARRCADEFAKDDVPEPEPVVAELVAPLEAAASSEVMSQATSVAPPSPPRPRPVEPPRPAAPLQAGSLFWVVVKAYCLKLLRTLGLAR